MSNLETTLTNDLREEGMAIEVSLTVSEVEQGDHAAALCTAFAEFAGDSLEQWQRIDGHRVTHFCLGQGIVCEVFRSPFSSELHVKIEFPHLYDNRPLRLFQATVFKEDGIFTSLEIPQDLHETLRLSADRIRQRRHAMRKAEERKRRRKELEEAVRQAGSFRVRSIFSQPRVELEDLNLVSNWLATEDVRQQILTLDDASLVSLVEGKLAENPELGRVLSARAAEKTAIEFFQTYGFAVDDVSITQLGNPEALDWRTHDLLVNGSPVDVKNARRSLENRNRYVEHCVPKFKRSRNGDDVWIIGILSPYLWPRSILAPETTPESWKKDVVFLDGDYSGTNRNVVLGLCNEGKMSALQHHFSKPGILDIDFTRRGFSSLKFLPPWLYDYPKTVYKQRDTALAQVKEMLTDDPDLLLELHGGDSVTKSLLLTTGMLIETACDLAADRHERSFLEAVAGWRSDQGLSLPYLYLSILAHFLEVVASGDVGDFSPRIYRSLVFGFPHLQVDCDRPLLILDPLRTIWELINTLESLWRGNGDSIRTYRRFALRGPGILQGQGSSRSAWKSLVAYCGCCGFAPLVLGSNPHCTDCWKLVCPACGYCSVNCTNNSSNRCNRTDDE